MGISLLSNTRKARRDIAALTDEIILNVETRTILSREGSPRASNMHAIELSEF